MWAVRTAWKSLFAWWLLQVAVLLLSLWWNSQLTLSFERRRMLENDWGSLASNSQRSGAATLCFDDQWRRLDCKSGLPVTDGQAVNWRSCDDHLIAGGLPGLLTIGQQQHSGLAHPRPKGGFVVQYLPIKTSAAVLEGKSRDQRSSMAITLVLAGGLFALLSYLVIGKAQDQLLRQRSQMERQALDQIDALQRTRDGIIFGLAKLAEFRDEDTGSHLERISAFATRLANELQRRATAGLSVDEDFLRLIGISAVLHDIGKVAIPDSILLKPAPLSPDERLVMQQHTVIGANCIAQIERRLGNSNFLRMAGEIAESHHERWDGSGYPHGLRGVEIPLAARIVAIVDVYDALSSRRVYKPPMSHEECLEVIRAEAGRHFDPFITEVFLEQSSEIETLAARYHSPLPSPLPPPAPLPRWNLARENEELVAAGDVADSQLWSGNSVWNCDSTSLLSSRSSA